MTPKFGSIGHMVTDNTDAVFMVIGPSGNPLVSKSVPGYRNVSVLVGTGWMGYLVGPGENGAVDIEAQDENIAWLSE